MLWLIAYLTVGGSIFAVDSYERPEVPALDSVLFALLWPCWLLVKLALFWEHAADD